MFDKQIFNLQYDKLSTKQDTILNSKDPLKSLNLLIIQEIRNLVDNAILRTTSKMTQEEENSRLQAIYHFYDMTTFDIIIKQQRELEALKGKN